jgi:hypothetical protein
MQIFKYADMQIYKYTNIQIYKYTNIQIYKYTNMIGWKRKKENKKIRKSPKERPKKTQLG